MTVRLLKTGQDIYCSLCMNLKSSDIGLYFIKNLQYSQTAEAIKFRERIRFCVDLTRLMIEKVRLIIITKLFRRPK